MQRLEGGDRACPRPCARQLLRWSRAEHGLSFLRGAGPHSLGAEFIVTHIRTSAWRDSSDAWALSEIDMRDDTERSPERRRLRFKLAHF
jgi:hypothetical protein